MLFSVLLYGAGGLASVAIILLVTFQERLVYVPVIPGQSRDYPYNPKRHFRMEYEDVELRASDGVKLHSWFIRSMPITPGPTILFFQENAGNIAHRLEFVDFMLRHLHCNVFMLSYRGYGASGGSPSQKGITLDAQAALEWLLARDDIDTDRIVAFGRSLGGAVASQLARNNPGKLAALVLENTFTSILDMAGVLLPVLRYVLGTRGFRPLNFLVRSPWRTIDIIADITEPTLFLSGKMDELVPPRMMVELHEAASGCQSKHFVQFLSGAHMDTWYQGGERYWRVLHLFLLQHAGHVVGVVDSDGCQSD